MKKSGTLLIFGILVLSCLIFGVSFVYTRFYAPNAKLSGNYIEIYKEVESVDVYKVEISSLNHNVQLKNSEDGKIHVSYYQKVDNANTFGIDGAVLRITMAEEVEKLDNMFYKSDKNLDTIVISIPEKQVLILTNKTVSGSFECEDIILSQLQIETVDGNITVKNGQCNKLTVTSNTGEMQINDVDVYHLSLTGARGKISVALPLDIYQYNVDIKNDYGSLYLNNEKIYEKVEVQPGSEEGEPQYQEVVVNHLQTTAQTDRSIYISTIRNSIYLTCPDPVETEVQTTAEN